LRLPWKTPSQVCLNVKTQGREVNRRTQDPLQEKKRREGVKRGRRREEPTRKGDLVSRKQGLQYVRKGDQSEGQRLRRTSKKNVNPGRLLKVGGGSQTIIWSWGGAFHPRTHLSEERPHGSSRGGLGRRARGLRHCLDHTTEPIKCPTIGSRGGGQVVRDGQVETLAGAAGGWVKGSNCRKGLRAHTP